VQQRERADDAVQSLLFPAQLLRALGVAPDIGLLELPPDLDQACLFGVEVKDTSAFPWRARPGR
jgi:hypothetical protein